MMTPEKPPLKLQAAEVTKVLDRADLSPEAAQALADCVDAAIGLHRLLQAGLVSDAARFVAHALPKREAVWWACMCARASAIAVPGQQNDMDALDAAEAWVRKPEEDSRRAAMAKAEAAGFRTPESWAAVGAFWSGGSMAPQGQPVVPPAEHLTGVAVAGAVSLAAVRNRPELADATLRKFLDSALDIAAGGPGRIVLNS